LTLRRATTRRTLLNGEHKPAAATRIVAIASESALLALASCAWPLAVPSPGRGLRLQASASGSRHCLLRDPASHAAQGRSLRSRTSEQIIQRLNQRIDTVNQLSSLRSLEEQYQQ